MSLKDEGREWIGFGTVFSDMTLGHQVLGLCESSVKEIEIREPLVVASDNCSQICG